MNNEINNFNTNKAKILKAIQNASHSAYYRDLFRLNEIDVAKLNTYEDFRKIPILRKQDYKECWYDLFSDKLKQKIASTSNDLFSLATMDRIKTLAKCNIKVVNTSGSTGLPLLVYNHNSDLFVDNFNLNVYRNKLVKDIFKTRCVMILPINIVKEKEIYGEIRSVHQDYDNLHIICVYEYSDNFFQNLTQSLASSGANWMISTPSTFFYYSEYLKKNNIKPVASIKYIECISEYLYDHQIELIENVLGVLPVSNYATHEVYTVGLTCPNNKLHVIQKNVFVELVENKGIKEVVVTKLNCKHIPVIRYNLGDLGEWDNSNCECAFHDLPILRLKSFRTTDYVIKKDGSKVEPELLMQSIDLINNGMHEHLKILQYQIIQKEPDLFIYKIKTNSELINYHRYQIILEQYFTKILNYPIKIKLEVLFHDIKNNSMDKFRLFKNEVEGIQ